MPPAHQVRIGIVGKYMELHDAYKSVWEALYHGGIANDAGVELVKIDSGLLEHADANLGELFAGIDGIFRFNARGLNERGLAVLEIRRGTSVAVNAAPRSFTGS